MYQLEQRKHQINQELMSVLLETFMLLTSTIGWRIWKWSLSLL